MGSKIRQSGDLCLARGMGRPDYRRVKTRSGRSSTGQREFQGGASVAELALGHFDAAHLRPPPRQPFARASVSYSIVVQCLQLFKRFTWKVGYSRYRKNPANEPRVRSSRPHAEADYPSARLGCISQLHPTEYSFAYNISAVVDLRRFQSFVLVALQTGGFCPNIARLFDHSAVSTHRCPDWNSPLAESVPTPQIP
jgi:hypothetical protein